jgi:dTDP-4-dehydrorhamnose reductase
VTALGEAPFTGPFGPIAWPRTAFDLDAPDGVAALLERERVEVVVHAAAWTDVDGCARDPGLALARNGAATAVLARACAERGLDLVVVSTNEVFDGRREDRTGYAATDEPTPANPYGASKLAGERAATDAFTSPGAGQLAVVRTSWLFGAGRPDFPAKILEAATRARHAGEPLRAVGDEWGRPTYAADLAEGIVELLAEGSFAGVHHLVNGGIATRAAWARDVVARAGIDILVEEVPASTWPRASAAPRWAVLEPTPLPSGEPLRPWPQAMADYAPILLRGRVAARTRSAR